MHGGSLRGVGRESGIRSQVACKGAENIPEAPHGVCTAMGLRINTNLASLTAQRYLFAAGRQVEGSLGRLASGLRIQSAADDAAGLAISERMRMRSRSWAQVERNTSDGIGLAKFVEGIYTGVGDMVARLRELAMASVNGTLSDADRGSLQAEAAQILEESLVPRRSFDWVDAGRHRITSLR